MATPTNNAINGPIPWKWSTSISGVFVLTPFHGYITNETVIGNIATFQADLEGMVVGYQYRIMSYGTGCVGFIFRALDAQKIWHNGNEGTMIQVNSGFGDGAAITITCIDATSHAQQFMVELGTGAVTLT